MAIKTHYKFIHFEKVEQKPKTAVWACYNTKSGVELGRVKWYGPWRRYCFFPSRPSVYSEGCLTNITSFIQRLMGERQ